MADKKISQLTALSAANVAPATDVLAIVDTSATETKKITAKDLIDGALNGGTANGVLYLNGSKVATSGSALVFDGTNLGIGTASPVGRADVNASISSTSVNTSLLNLKNTLGSGRNGNELFGITFQAVDQTNSTTYTAAAIYNRNPNSSADYDSGELLFYTKSPGTYSAAPTERLRLDSSGNLGLGVTPSTYATIPVLNIGKSGTFYGDGNTYNWTVGMGQNCVPSGASAWKARTTGQYAALYEQISGQHAWYTTNATQTAGNTISFTQAMTLDASGNLVLGETSTSYRFQIGNGTTTGVIRAGTAFTSIDSGYQSAGVYGTAAAPALIIGGDDNTGIWHPASDVLAISTGGTERARITSEGNFYVNTTGAGGKFYVVSDLTANNGLRVDVPASFTATAIALVSATAAGGGWYFLTGESSGGSARIQIVGTGDVNNANGTYGTISDARLKQDIVDAPSQWNDIKAIKFRKYRMKSDVEADPNAPALLGVVAQELAQVSPGLVDEHPNMKTVEVTDEEGNVTQTQQPTGTTTMTVKSSILLMKAAVALQEAMARIEQLEADMAALKASA